VASTEPGIGSGMDLPVSPARAFALLSDPAELCKWFAEEVRIAPHAGGAFAFAGRGAYAPVATTLTQFEAGHIIGWDWPLRGVIGHVTLTVSAKDTPNESRVDVLCHFPLLPPIPRAPELIDDLWRFYLGNLKTHAEGGAGVLLPDFSDPVPEVRQTIHIAAPRAAVFRALVDPKLLNAWCYGESSVEPHVGGRYSYGWSYEVDGKKVDGGPTRILAYIENEKLVTDWPDWRGDASNNSQTITWLLEDDGKGTKLTLLHSGFARASDICDYPFGWAGYLDGIARAVTGEVG
jgi:uncharacterized protein YndB with AHSA1/START domain